MKTLKKTLCLVLALVMLLGMGAISASATLDYSDNDRITYAEAVDVMSGIGVLVGDEGGFRPTDTVRRSEAAKIIAYLLIGNAAQADRLSTTVDPFTDVPASHWAAGYIAYCVQAGIINGMGDGTFQPDSPVTGLQFAKMLLCAIGYNANSEYVTDDWTIQVSKDALALKLFEKNLAGANNTPATREECALYAFNAIRKYKVTYSALLGGYIETGMYAGVGGADNAKARIQDDFKLHEYDHFVNDGGDVFGRETGHHWYVEKSTNIISADYDEDKNLQATYTTGVTGADIYNLLGKAFIDDTKLVTVYTDGVEVPRRENHNHNDTVNEICLDNFNKNNTKDLEGTGNGVQTIIYAGEFPVNDDTGKDAYNYITVVIINTYLARVTDVKAGTSVKDPVTKVDVLKDWNTNTKQEKAYPIEEDVETGNGFNTEDFDEDDYVLITAAMENNEYKIQSMSPVNVVSSTITRYNKTNNVVTVTAGGTQYVAAKNVASDQIEEIYAANNDNEVNSNALVNGDKHTLYVDDYGYLIALSDVEIESDYVYVAQFGNKIDTSDTLAYKENLVADIYYADGSHGIVPIDIEHGKDGKKTSVGENDIANKGVDEDTDYRKLNDPDDPDDMYSIGVYELTMYKGKAILTNQANDQDVPSGANVTKGISKIGGSDYKANDRTVFFYVHDEYKNEDEFSVTVYTGINNIPVSKANGAVGGIGHEAESVAAIVDPDDARNMPVKAVLVNSQFDSDVSDTVYFYTGISYDFLALGETRDDPYTITYEVYVDGEKQELILEYENYDDAADAQAAANDENNGFIGKFFTVKDNDTHDFTEIKYRYTYDQQGNLITDDEGNPLPNDAATKVNTSYYQIDVQLTKNAALFSYFDNATITDDDDVRYSYTANTAKFVDLRSDDDIDDDDRYTRIASVQDDWGDNELESVTFAVIFDDTDSQRISVIYLTDVVFAQ